MRVLHLPREVFIREVFRPGYRPGQHVGFLGPTQTAGKTHTGFQLLEAVATPEMPATALIAKPRDETVDKWAARLEWPESPDFPPRRRPFAGKAAGELIWPRHTLTDSKRDKEHLADVFGRAITWNYGHGPRITFADELYRLCQLGLADDIDAVLTGGAGMKSAIWYGTQKPSGTVRTPISSFAYDQPFWLFISYDPDRRNRKRYGEIGGVDPRLIEATTEQLRRREWFVFHRESGGVCTISA